MIPLLVYSNLGATIKQRKVLLVSLCRSRKTLNGYVLIHPLLKSSLCSCVSFCLSLLQECTVQIEVELLLLE